MKSAAQAYQRVSKRDSLESLILGNIDYVKKILSTMTIAVKDENERENLEAAGLLGLVQAAHKFDPTQPASFRTFAYRRIVGAILDELRVYAPVSQQMLSRIRKVKSAYETLSAPVTPEMLAEATGMSVEKIQDCLEAMRFLKPDGWNDFHAVVHSSWNVSSDNPEHAVEREEMKNLLVQGLQGLEEKQRLVVTLYYNEELKLKEIGAVLDLSESRVSRIMALAVFNLQEFVRARTQ